MPIEGRSPRECAERFRRHVAELLANTIAPSVPLLLYEGAREATFGVSFRQGKKLATLPLDTVYGKLFLHLAQLVEAEKIDKKYRLKTLAYWYRLQPSAGLRETDALLRWEYDRCHDPRQPGPPRHHLQAAATVKWDAQVLDLNRLHTPSGWITIEELLRFLIIEFGVAPASADWPRIVADSEDVFFREFSGKRRRSGA
ncbi:MAG TPA: hypothetical protein VFK85_06740 [Anaeromyxobacteraceae bacterium]|nr:hypothetical protein [Anaeromyxobacteraceae bacterium]